MARTRACNSRALQKLNCSATDAQKYRKPSVSWLSAFDSCSSLGRRERFLIYDFFIVRKRTKEIESRPASPNNPDSSGCNRACFFLGLVKSGSSDSWFLSRLKHLLVLIPLNWPARCVKLTPRDPTAVSAKTFLHRATWRCHRCRVQRMKSVAEIMVLQVCRTSCFGTILYYNSSSTLS